MIQPAVRIVSGARRFLLGTPDTLEVSPSEVDARVDACQDVDVLERLFDFGRQLLDALERRNAAIESKATSLIGYNTAILAFLATRAQTPGASSLALNGILVALIGVFAATACTLAFMTLRAAQNWKALGELSWFPTDRNSYTSKDRLIRSYIQAMHQMLQENQRIVGKKADQLVKAQLSLICAAICLAAWFAATPLVAAWSWVVSLLRFLV